MVIAIIAQRIARVVLTMEITAVVELGTLRKRPWEEKVQRPVKRRANLFVQGGQFAEINRPPMSAGENLAGNFSPDAQTDTILPQVLLVLF